MILNNLSASFKSTIDDIIGQARIPGADDELAIMQNMIGSGDMPDFASKYAKRRTQRPKGMNQNFDNMQKPGDITGALPRTR